MNIQGEHPMTATRKSRKLTRLLLVTALVALSVPFAPAPPAMAATSTLVNGDAQAKWLETQALLEPYGTTNRLDWTSATLIVKSDTTATTISKVQVQYSVKDTGSWETAKDLVSRGTGEPTTNPGGSLNYWTQRSPGASEFNYWTIRTYAEQNGTHGIGCDNIWPYDETRSGTRKVRYTVTMSDGSVMTTSDGSVRLNGNGGCSGPEDYPRLTTTSVTSGTPADTAPGGSVTFSFKCDDSDTSGNDVCDRYKWRWRRLNDGAVGADSSDISTGGDNTAVSLSASVPSARGRYVIEAKLGNEDGSYPQTEYWRLGEVSVATNSTAANTPEPSVSCPSPIFTGDNYTVTATAGDATADVSGRTQMIEWDTNNDGTFETTTRRPTSATPGLTDETTAVSGTDLQRQFTAPGSPGTQSFKVKTYDNGAMAASDTITRTKQKDAGCTIRSRPDLTVDSVTRTGGTFAVGETGQYTIAVKNTGPGDTVGTVGMRDVLPTGLTYSSASGTGWTCSNSGQEVRCTRTNSITTGGSAPDIVLNVTVDATAAATLANTATADADPTTGAVDATVGETDTSNNSKTNSYARPDLTLTKARSGGTFSVGETGQYTFTLTNSVGDGPTSGTYGVRDDLPTGVTLQLPLSPGNGWDCSTSTTASLRCTRSTVIADGGSVAFNATVNVAEGAAATLTNTAKADRDPSTGAVDPTAGEVSVTNNDGTDTYNRPDLTITKTRPNGAFDAGQQGTYRFTVTNGGTGATTGTYGVRDPMPAGLTLVTPVPAQNNWDCSASTSSLLQCTRTTALGASASTQFDVTVNVDDTTTPIANTADADATPATAGISPTTAESSITTNQSATDNVTPRRPNLTLSSSHTGNFTVGMPGGGTYTLTASNIAGATGSTLGKQITVSDTLPTGLVPTAASGSGWGCSIVVQIVTCTSTATLAPNTSANTIAVTVRPEPAALGTQTHQPSVSITTDTDATNNQASESTVVGHSIKADVLAQVQPLGAPLPTKYTVHLEVKSYPNAGSINDSYLLEIRDKDTQNVLYSNNKTLPKGTLWANPAALSVTYNFSGTPKVRGVATGQFTLDGNNGGTSTVKLDVLPLFTSSFTGRVQIKDPNGNPVLPDPPSGTLPFWVYPVFNPTTVDFQSP